MKRSLANLAKHTISQLAALVGPNASPAEMVVKTV